MNLPVSSSRAFLLKKQKDMLREPLIRAAWHRICLGVSSNGDGDNSIVVRGNSPQGVLWRVWRNRNSSPNHFGGLGGSGGSISMLSSSTLGNSDFYTGAFPAEFGNATAGAFDLKFRDGNKDKHEHSFHDRWTGNRICIRRFLKRRHSFLSRKLPVFYIVIVKRVLDHRKEFYPKPDLSFKLNFPTKAGEHLPFSVSAV